MNELSRHLDEFPRRLGLRIRAEEVLGDFVLLVFFRAALRDLGTNANTRIAWAVGPTLYILMRLWALPRERLLHFDGGRIPYSPQLQFAGATCPAWPLALRVGNVMRREPRLCLFVCHFASVCKSFNHARAFIPYAAIPTILQCSLPTP